MLGAERSATEASALSAAEFAALMAPLGPFELNPHLVVGVSGGADSMALCLLAHDWGRARGGIVSALTVDHGLRSDSAAEAARVAAWLGALGIEHHVLVWHGSKPETAIQAEARSARRRLMGAWCRDRGALHLLLAHHREDQAVTLLMRRERGSGTDGLAAMAPIAEAGWGRVLRPLLDVANARLRATLVGRGQDWIEDPSNRDPRFARTRLRAGLDDLAGGGRAANLSAEASRHGYMRARSERACADLLATAAVIYPQGYVRLDPDSLARAPEAIAARALRAMLMACGGAVYPPRQERFAGLFQDLRSRGLGGGRTLGGCCIRPWRGDVLVAREAGAIAGSMPVTPGRRVEWDGRFLLRLRGAASAEVAVQHQFRVAALGEAGWRQIVGDRPELRKISVPAAVRPSLPALWDLDGVREVPHLIYRRRSADPDSVFVEAASFRPVHPLAGPVVAVLGRDPAFCGSVGA